MSKGHQWRPGRFVTVFLSISLFFFLNFVSFLSTVPSSWYLFFISSVLRLWVKGKNGFFSVLPFLYPPPLPSITLDLFSQSVRSLICHSHQPHHICLLSQFSLSALFSKWTPYESSNHWRSFSVPDRLVTHHPRQQACPQDGLYLTGLTFTHLFRDEGGKQSPTARTTQDTYIKMPSTSSSISRLEKWMVTMEAVSLLPPWSVQYRAR